MIAQTKITKSEDETIELGRDFAKNLKAGDTVALFGEVGAGKTEFVKGICDFLKVNEFVTSPTFTIINQYHGLLNDKKITIYHIDLYRIQKKDEFADIGLADCIYQGNSIKLVEWAEKANEVIPTHSYSITLRTSDSNEDDRIITITQN